MSGLTVAALCIAYWLARTEPVLAGRCWSLICRWLRARDVRRYRKAAPHMRSAVATVAMVHCRHARRCTEPSNSPLCACQRAYQRERQNGHT